MKNISNIAKILYVENLQATYVEISKLQEKFAGQSCSPIYILGSSVLDSLGHCCQDKLYHLSIPIDQHKFYL